MNNETAVKAPEALPGETFQQHPTIPAFLVSDYGRVWSKSGKRIVGFCHDGGRKNLAAGKVKPAVHYWRAQDDSGKNHYIHVLVLETFIGPRPEGHDSDHINHVRNDNRLENLRWRELGANRADTIRNKKVAA